MQLEPSITLSYLSQANKLIVRLQNDCKHMRLTVITLSSASVCGNQGGGGITWSKAGSSKKTSGASSPDTGGMPGFSYCDTADDIICESSLRLWKLSSRLIIPCCSSKIPLDSVAIQEHSQLVRLNGTRKEGVQRGKLKS
jgi:hypothetical protein